MVLHGGGKGVDLEKGIQLILALWGGGGDTVRDRRCQEAEELEKVNFGSEKARMLCLMWVRVVVTSLAFRGPGLPLEVLAGPLTLSYFGS